MIEKSVAISPVGSSGIVCGALEHGLKRMQNGNVTLLVGEADRARIVEDELTRQEFFLSTEKASTIAYEVLENFETEKKKPPKKLMSDIARLLFNVRLLRIFNYQFNLHD